MRCRLRHTERVPDRSTSTSCRLRCAVVKPARISWKPARSWLGNHSHQLQYQIRACGTITTDTACVEQFQVQARLPSSPSTAFLEPSYDLRLLCTKQLETIYEILRRSNTVASANSIRSTVYVRSPEVISSNDLIFHRVVSLFPEQPAQPFSELYAQAADDDFLRLAAPEGQVSVEEYLLQQGNLALPNSPTVVLPLAQQDCLVGLLVLERHLPPPENRPWGQAAAGSGSSVFTEEEVWLFGTMVPALAQSCFMSLRSALHVAQASARQQRAAALVSGARGSVTALRTFGSMLLPRLREGEPDSDLASNMVVQSKQLEEVVKQLEAALRPDPPSMSPSQFFPSTDPITPLGQDYPPFFPFTPARDYHDTRVPSDVLHPHRSPSPNAPPHPTPTSPPLTPPRPNLPTAPTARPASSTTPTPTWSAHPPRPTSPPPRDSLTVHREPHGRLLPAASSSDPACSALLPPIHAASSGMISLDLDLEQLQRPLTHSPPTLVLPPRQASHAAASTSAAAGDECNVADALVNVLTAAYKMCTVRSIQAIICHPLRTHTRPPRKGAAGAAAAAGVPRLLPRPVRPLRAAVPAAMVAQAMSYVLEVVLASCSQGGLVGVYAHPTESPPLGIQLIVLFTGTLRMVTDALAAEWQLALGSTAAGWGGTPAAGESSLELAQGLLQRVGGRISITYPCKLKSKLKQTVEPGTCVEVWLPAAKQHKPPPQQQQQQQQHEHQREGH